MLVVTLLKDEESARDSHVFFTLRLSSKHSFTIGLSQLLYDSLKSY